MSWFSIGAAAISGLGSYFSAKQSQANAREQMAFQKEMYQNRHQYEVDDLRKAGLNPILSAGGQPPTVSGAQGSVPDYGNAVAQGINAYSAKAQARKAVENLEKEGEVLDSQAEKNRADASAANATADATRQNTGFEAQLFPDRQALLKATTSEKEQAIEVAKQSVQKMKADIQNSTEVAHSEAARNYQQAYAAFKSGQLSESQMAEVAARTVLDLKQAGYVDAQTATEVQRGLGLASENEYKSLENSAKKMEREDPLWKGSHWAGSILDNLAQILD